MKESRPPVQPLILTNRAAAIIFFLTGLLWISVEAPRLLRLPRKETAETHDRGSLLVALAGLWLGLLLGIALARGATIGVPLAEPVFGVGAALVATGILFRGYAIHVLGRYFTPVVAIQSGHEIVQSGPYRLLRHPSYTGIVISLLGVGLMLTNWVGLLALLCCGLAGLLYRIAVEERELLRAFGQPYAEYMRHTWRLIPLLY